MHGHYAPDLKRMAEIGDEGVFALISDSTEAEKPGYNTPENIIEHHMYDAFARLKVDLLYHAMLQTSFVFNKCLTLQVNLIVKCHF